MSDEYEKTVSVYDYKKKNDNKNYQIVICDRKGHRVINLNDFGKDVISFGRVTSLSDEHP